MIITLLNLKLFQAVWQAWWPMINLPFLISLSLSLWDACLLDHRLPHQRIKAHIQDLVSSMQNTRLEASPKKFYVLHQDPVSSSCLQIFIYFIGNSIMNGFRHAESLPLLGHPDLSKGVYDECIMWDRRFLPTLLQLSPCSSSFLFLILNCLVDFYNCDISLVQFSTSL